MNFYQNLGSLVLGTRLKRQSDYFLTEVNKVYTDQGIAFEASWFGVFYLLSENGTLSIYEIAEKLEVSHSAISQLIKTLDEKELVIVNPSMDDARKKVINLSKNGLQLLEEIKPIWYALSSAMDEILEHNELLNSLLILEKQFSKTPLNQRIKACLVTEKID